MVALADGQIELRRGEAHALVGENGAGKSTLVKILAGVHRPDAGRLLLDGGDAILDNAAQSQAAGIAIIFQEPTLFPDLTVAENIFVGCQPLRAGRRIDRRRMRREAAALFAGARRAPRPGPPGARAFDRRPADRRDRQGAVGQRAGNRDGRADRRPDPVEVDRLFRVVETLREGGAAVLFISHRLEEVFALCQRVTVMRDGRLVLTRPIGRDDARSPSSAPMVGRDMDALFPKVEAQRGEVVLAVERLTREGVFTDVSFEVRRGEIVALAGLVGAGRTEVARAIFGIDR